MPWFHNSESGQTFEAVGVWEKEARDRGCKEVKAPKETKADEAPKETKAKKK